MKSQRPRNTRPKSVAVVWPHSRYYFSGTPKFSSSGWQTQKCGGVWVIERAHSTRFYYGTKNQSTYQPYLLLNNLPLPCYLLSLPKKTPSWARQPSSSPALQDGDKGAYSAMLEALRPCNGLVVAKWNSDKFASQSSPLFTKGNLSPNCHHLDKHGTLSFFHVESADPPSRSLSLIDFSVPEKKEGSRPS